jgi:VIT1/CCC1 family predicted Fe2+/Mn2+ transporter
MSSQSKLARLKASLEASAGDIVFGMEDGTVSIFGLVFGVAATTDDKSTVLIAGATGAVAAAVSMMAGTYLDVETSQDEARAASAMIDSEVERNPAAAVEQVMVRLRAAGAGPDQIKSMTGLLRSDPKILKAAATALAAPAAPDTTQGPLAHSLWMLVADFLAAAIPIAPFALLPVGQGRVVSGTVTLILLVCLGLGRAWVGNRGVLRTVVETVSIGVAAALAGVAVGTAISHWFGG